MAPYDLEREVFGGSDSDFSTDDEEDLQQLQRPTAQPQQHSQATSQEASASSGADSEDDYVHEDRVVGKAKKRSVSRRKKRATEDGEERPVQRKRKRRSPVEVDLSELPPEQAAKVRLDMKIEAILKPKKASRQRKKKNNEEVLDSYADDEVARLRETMNNAADEDIRMNSEKLPATAKLRLLPEAMETLRKASLAQSIIDNNLLEAVKRWLEPLPDRSLPALNIQRELFTTIRKMEFIDTAVLKESGLGRIVLFYTKCKRVTADIRKIADELVSTWSRPIIKRSASYRDRHVPIVASEIGGGGGMGGDHGGLGGGMHREGLNAILAKMRQEDKNRVKKNAVMIPQRHMEMYTVAPKPNAGVARPNVSVDVDIERRRKNAERLRLLTRKVISK